MLPIFMFILVFLICYHASGIDVTVIYRLNDPKVEIRESQSLKVPTGEAHIRTNALGLFPDARFYDEIYSGNMQFVFPACYAFRNSCEWEMDGWNLVPYTSWSGIIPSSDHYDCTMNKNLECHQIHSYERIGSIHLYSHDHFSRVIDATGYNFIAVIFDDPNGEGCQDFRCTISEISDNSYYGRHEIYSFYRYEFNKMVVSQRARMLLEGVNRCAKAYSISYYIGNETTYALNTVYGYMKSPTFIPFTSQLCIGIGYKAGNISVPDIRVFIETDDFKINMNKHRTYNHENSVFYTTFLVDLSEERKNLQYSVTVHVSKETYEQFSINIIEKCSLENMEKIIVLNQTNFPFNRSNILSEKPPESACINGGIWSNNEKSCICPAGFTGDICQIGCGPNRYGDDCSGECSRFLNKCKGLLMCKYKLPCVCAPGFKGQFCNISCNPGEYGANCENKCNNCFNGTLCDPYTGYCNFGCEKGYHSPICYYKYQYLDIAPVVTLPTFDSLAVTVSFSNISGRGNAKFYQVQYKEKNEKFWSQGDIKLIPDKPISDIIDINGLKAGSWYNVRAVLIDKDSDSYDGEDIPYTTIQTHCLIPDSMNYKLQSYSISQTSFKISWQYDPDNVTSCTLTKFEVYLKEQWRWLLYWNDSDYETKISELLPGETFFVKLHAVTINGPANSEILAVTTLGSDLEAVTDLEVTVSEADRIRLKWQPPKYSAQNIEYYVVKYECKQLLGCPDEDCSYMKGSFKVFMPHAVINGLLPHAQYIVSIAPLSVSEGPAFMKKVATDQTAPNVMPDKSQRQIYNQKNSSFTVSWKYPSICKGFNGYFSHYEYDLVESISEQGSYNTSILRGSTRNTSMEFKGLKPHSTYYVKVYVVTTAGINLSYPLVIKSSTKAAVPGPVQKLTVYKKGRKMVGLRWAIPTELHGSLQSFTVTYKRKYSDDIYTSVVEPTHCPAWSHLYCHTITSLSADNEYIFTVSARNSEISEDGDEASIETITKEEAPGVPTNLEILSQTETSILIQWRLPHLLNGVLRSFLITIEETDSFNTTNCCQDFPLKTLTVRQEEPHYTYQFTGLHSASTYTISVSAKTTVMGPVIVATGHTKPSLISMNKTIEVLQDGNQETVIRVKLSPVKQYVDLIKGYLLLVVPQNDTLLPDTVTEVQTKDEVLTNELLDIIDEPFYIAAEFQQNDVINYPEVELGTGSSPVIGVLSHIQDQYLTKGSKYKLALVLVLQYCGVYSLPHVFTPVIMVN